MDADEVSDVIDRFFTAIEAGDRATITALYHDDVSVWHSATANAVDKAAAVAILDWLMAPGVRLRYEVLEQVVVAGRVSRRHILHIALPDREPIIMPVSIYLTVEDGQITRIDEYVDAKITDELIAAIPVPGAAPRAPRRDVERIAYGVVYAEESDFKDTYGGVEGIVFLESYLLRPVDTPSDTVIVFMHPVGGGAYLPLVNRLARDGNHVIYCNSRYRGIDSALIMEKVVLDLGAAIRDAKDRLGYTKVVLGGWSGGGSLSLYYQEQAEHPTVTATPAGDPPDLTKAGLIPADGLMLLAAHPSRHGVLDESLDPSIRDEANPDDRDPDLDLYDPNSAHQPPYDLDWLERYRAAQVARNRRITAWVKTELAQLKADGRPHEERGFVVHGTMADPAALDVTIDPNERPAGISYLGDPQIVNNGPVGLARFCTLRSWLSQWSHDDALADGLRAAAAITVPVLVIYNGADSICLPSLATSMYDAVKHDDRQLHCVDGANHYYIGPDQHEKVKEASEVCTTWLVDHGFAPND